MKKKIWFYLYIIQTIVLVGIIVVGCFSLLVPKVQNNDLKEYLEQFSESNNYVPEVRYIPDEKTAKTVGSCIIDNLSKHNWFGRVYIEYDETNRLWKVNKGYLFNQGGFVVIEQDSGKIIKALLSK